MSVEFTSKEACACGSHDRREEQYGYSRNHDYRHYEFCVDCGRMLAAEYDNRDCECATPCQ